MRFCLNFKIDTLYITCRCLHWKQTAIRDATHSTMSFTHKAFHKIRSETAGTAKSIVYAVLIAVVIRTFLFEPFHIPSSSMVPTLLVGDYLFVEKYAYGYGRYSLPLGLPLFNGRVLAGAPHRGDEIGRASCRERVCLYV